MSNTHTTENEAWAWVHEHMPVEVTKALTKLVEVNPHQSGIDWWTALDILRDCDAHLDIIEPMCEQMPEWGVLQSYVTLTLIYADKHFSLMQTTNMRVITVRATIANNSRGEQR